MALEFYKKGQGFYTRVGTATGVGILTVLGCNALRLKLGALSLDPQNQAWVKNGIPTVVLLILAWVIFKVLNSPRVADFMIATEGEMKKVSWSTRKEIITSTKVVLITVFLMATLLAGVDWIFYLFFETIGVLEGLEATTSV